MAGRPRADVTDAELAVLKELWALGPATIRQLTDRLYPDGSASEYATVQKLLERLEQKRCVRRKAQGRVNVYSPVAEREDLIDLRLRDTASKLCEGSLTPLLTHLVGATRLSGEEIADLRRLVDSLDRDDEGGRR